MEEKVKNNFIKVHRSFISNLSLSSNDKIVYLAIKFYYELSSENKKCTASYKHIAEFCCVSTRTVLRAIDNLRKLGYIFADRPTLGDTLTIILNEDAIGDTADRLPGSHRKGREICHNFKGNIWALHSNSKIAYRIYLKLRS